MNTLDQQNVSPYHPSDTACAGRQTAKDVLQGLINRKYEQARNLKVLMFMLPSQMTEEQDAALWSILTELPR